MIDLRSGRLIRCRGYRRDASRKNRAGCRPDGHAHNVHYQQGDNATLWIKRDSQWPGSSALANRPFDLGQKVYDRSNDPGQRI